MCGGDSCVGEAECGNSATKCVKCPWYGNGCRYGRGPNNSGRLQVDEISNKDIIDGLKGRLFDADQIALVEHILNDMRNCLAREEGKERRIKKDTEDTGLVEYKFNKLEAMQHIEKVHGKKLVSFRTGTAPYDETPRVFWRLEDQKKEIWDNPDPMLGGACIDALFFPGEKVVSRKISVYDETFEFVVREKRDRIETAKKEKEA